MPLIFLYYVSINLFKYTLKNAIHTSNVEHVLNFWGPYKVKNGDFKRVGNFVWVRTIWSVWKHMIFRKKKSKHEGLPLKPNH